MSRLQTKRDQIVQSRFDLFPRGTETFRVGPEGASYVSVCLESRVHRYQRPEVEHPPASAEHQLWHGHGRALGIARRACGASPPPDAAAESRGAGLLLLPLRCASHHSFQLSASSFFARAADQPVKRKRDSAGKELL